MPEIPYMLAVLAIVFTVTLALRAVPFAVLARLRTSRLAAALATWMPPGILVVLAASTVRSTVTTHPAAAGYAIAAVAVTSVVHLLGGRRTHRDRDGLPLRDLIATE